MVAITNGYDGHPFDYRTVAELVLVDGQVAYNLDEEAGQPSVPAESRTRSGTWQRIPNKFGTPSP